MKVEFICTIHNFKFGFDPIPGYKSEHVRCPLCLMEESAELRSRNCELQEHRDLLLGAINLKLTLEKKT